MKYLLAGAYVVPTASASLRHHGSGYLGQLVKRLAEWPEAQGAASVAEIRGRMGANRCACTNPACSPGVPCQDARGAKAPLSKGMGQRVIETASRRPNASNAD